MKRPLKEHCERIHAKRRAEERLGLKLNREQYRLLRDRIMARGPGITLLEKQSRRISKFAVMLDDGRTVPVIWDRKRNEIVTFLPVEALQSSE